MSRTYRRCKDKLGKQIPYIDISPFWSIFSNEYIEFVKKFRYISDCKWVYINSTLLKEGDNTRRRSFTRNILHKIKNNLDYADEVVIKKKFDNKWNYD